MAKKKLTKAEIKQRLTVVKTQSHALGELLEHLLGEEAEASTPPPADDADDD